VNIKGHLLKILLLFVLAGSVANADISVIPVYKINGNSVYYRTENGLEKLQNADAKTFEILGYHIAKDKNAVYTLNTDDDKIVTVFSSKENDYKINELSGVNPNTFEMIEPSYFKDDKNVYYFSDKEKMMIKVENVDTESFEIMNDDYAKDKNNAYYKGKIFKEADSKTLDKHYNENDNGYKIRDKKKVYKIKELD
jgi:putative uncharacterized protein (fragment)